MVEDAREKIRRLKQEERSLWEEGSFSQGDVEKQNEINRQIEEIAEQEGIDPSNVSETAESRNRDTNGGRDRSGNQETGDSQNVQENLESTEESLKERQLEIAGQDPGTPASELAQRYRQRAERIGQRENFSQGDAREQSFYSRLARKFEDREGRYQVDVQEDQAEIQRVAWQGEEGELLNRDEALDRVVSQENRLDEAIEQVNQVEEQRDRSTEEKGTTIDVQERINERKENQDLLLEQTDSPTDDPMVTQYSSGTEIPGGYSGLLADPELREQVVSANRFNTVIANPEGWEYLGSFITRDSEARTEVTDEAVQRIQEDEFDVGDAFSSPAGTAATAVPIGVAGQATLRGIGAVSQGARTLAEGGLAFATGAYAGSQSAEAAKEFEQGDETEATGTLLQTGADLGAVGGSFRAVGNRIAPRVADTAVTRSDAFLQGTDSGTEIGTGNIEAETNVVTPTMRPWADSDVESVSAQTDNLLLQRTDEGVTAAGEMRIERTGDQEDLVEPFFGTSRPAEVQPEAQDTVISRERLEVGDETRFGLTRTQIENQENIDAISGLGPEGQIRMEGDFEATDFTSAGRTDEGTEILGEGRTVVENSERNVNRPRNRDTDPEGSGGGGTRGPRDTDSGDGQTVREEPSEIEDIDEATRIQLQGLTEEAADTVQRAVDTDSDTVVSPGTQSFSKPVAEDDNVEVPGPETGGQQLETLNEDETVSQPVDPTGTDTQAFETEERAVFGSPLEDTEELTRDPVSDRLTEEVRVDTEETVQRSQDTLDQPSIDTQVDVQEPVTQEEEIVPPGLQETTDVTPVLTRGTVLGDPTALDQQQDTLSTQTSFQQPTLDQSTSQLQRPLDDNALAPVRGQMPEVREDFIHEEETFPVPRQINPPTIEQTQTTGLGQPFPGPGVTEQPFPPRQVTRPGIGAPPFGGFPEPEEDGSTFNTEFDSEIPGPGEPEFTPDLTGTFFGGGVEEGPVTGLERRSPEFEEEEEENSDFPDPRII